MKYSNFPTILAVRIVALVSTCIALTAPAEVLVYRTTEVSKTTGNNKIRTVVGQGFTVYDVAESKAMIILSFNAAGKTYRTNEITNIMVASSVGPPHNPSTTFAASSGEPNYSLSFLFLMGKEFTLTLSTNATIRAPRNMTGLIRSIQFQNATDAVVVESSLNLHFAPAITATNNNAQHTYNEVVASLIAETKARGFAEDK